MGPRVRAHPERFLKLPRRVGQSSRVKESQRKILPRIEVVGVQATGFLELRRGEGKLALGVESRGQVEMGVCLVRRGSQRGLKMNDGFVKLLLSRQPCAQAQMRFRMIRTNPQDGSVILRGLFHPAALRLQGAEVIPRLDKLRLQAQ